MNLYRINYVTGSLWEDGKESKGDRRTKELFAENETEAANNARRYLRGGFSGGGLSQIETIESVEYLGRVLLEGGNDE